MTCQECLAPPYFPTEGTAAGPPVIHGETYEEHVKRLAEVAGSVHVTIEMSPTTKPEDVAEQVGRAFREGLERGL